MHSSLKTFLISLQTRSEVFTHEENMAYLKSNAFDHNLYLSYDRDETGKTRRVILRSNKIVKNVSQFHIEANGMIIDCNTWEVLVIPAGTPNHQFKGMIRDFNIYEACDGTTVTLYYWNDTWNIATSGAYDMSNVKWCGNKTYAEILFEVLSKYPEFVDTYKLKLVDGRLNMTLDPKFSYTIGFRHHEFHQFKDDTDRVWQIQIANLATKECESILLSSLPEQVRVMETFKSIAEMRIKLESLYNMYISKSTTLAGKVKPPYGYILRNGANVYIVESPLMH